MQIVEYCLRTRGLSALLVMVLCSIGGVGSLHANKVKDFLKVTQEIPNFGGINRYTDGKLLVCGYNKNVRLFDPKKGNFISSLLVLPDENFSYPNDVAVIPANATTNFPGAIVAASFLDGRVWAKVGDQAPYIVQSETNFQTAPNTGVNAFTFDPFLQGIQGIAYRKSDNMVYTQSAFDPTEMWKLDWTQVNVTPISIPLTPNAIINYFDFGPDDKIYGADIFNKKLVRVDPNTGNVEFLVDVPTIVAAKVDSQGIVYYLDRSTGTVASYDSKTRNLPELVAIVEPALTDLTLSEDETKLYVTNDQSTIYEINIRTGKVKVIFKTPIVGPWDLAYDNESETLFVADNGSLKSFDKNGKLQRKLTTDANTSGLFGFGLIAGLQVEEGDNAEIVLSDNTIGNIAVVYKKDFSVKTQFLSIGPTPAESTNVEQVFSAVHVKNMPGTPSEFYLATSPGDGRIVKMWRDFYTPQQGPLHVEDYFTGLQVPVKLKIKDGYLYVVEAGQVLNNIPFTGSVSRIPLSQHPSLSDKQTLVTGLNSPQGFDFFDDDKMLIAEADSQRIVQALARVPSFPTVVQADLQMSNGNLIYQFAPVNIHPFKGLACTPSGNCIWVTQDANETIGLIKVK